MNECVTTVMTLRAGFSLCEVARDGKRLPVDPDALYWRDVREWGEDTAAHNAKVVHAILSGDEPAPCCDAVAARRIRRDDPEVETALAIRRAQ
jgi:hypothetical protein